MQACRTFVCTFCVQKLFRTLTWLYMHQSLILNSTVKLDMSRILSSCIEDGVCVTHLTEADRHIDCPIRLAES
jgi:hypothetical protein